jgi:hypothetical protein
MANLRLFTICGSGTLALRRRTFATMRWDKLLREWRPVTSDIFSA